MRAGRGPKPTRRSMWMISVCVRSLSAMGLSMAGLGPDTEGMRDRPAADLIVFALTGLVCLVTVGMLVFALILETNGHDASEGINWVARLINTMVGGIFGYLAGRTITKSNGNGKPPSE